MVSVAQDNMREGDRDPNDYWTFALEFEVGRLATMSIWLHAVSISACLT